VYVGNNKPAPVAGAIGCLLSQLLVENGGLLLHGAFLLHNGLAHVFLGKPGAGKSTIVRNVSGIQAVHEEKVAVRHRRGKWWAYGVPLLDNQGKTGKNVSAPLTSLYLIEKSDSLRRYPLGRREALLEMPFHVVLPMSDTESRRTAFENLFSLVDGVSLWRLRFRRDSDVSKVV
jgi:ABC-type phosphate/phosphonate transport system ATPase subunit